MIESLEKLLEIKKKHFIVKMWGIIDELGWGIKSTDYNSMGIYLDRNYPDRIIIQLREFVRDKRKEIIKTLLDHAELKTGNKYSYYPVGDDGFWDLTAHIVGLGKYWFDKITNDPEIAYDIASNHMHKENFQYVFNHTEVIQKEREAKRIKLFGVPKKLKESVDLTKTEVNAEVEDNKKGEV